MVSLEDKPDALQAARVPSDLSAQISDHGARAAAPADLSHGSDSTEASETPETGDAASVADSEAPTSERPQEQPAGPQGDGDTGRPSFVFFGVVAAISLIADIGTKVWAEVTLNARGFEPLDLIPGNLSITLAYNKGGAWGLLAQESELIRKPFFLGVSAFAILFIISLYARLQATQKALKWGLPLVLGGALGNLSDRITRSQVIDFIDYRADWVMHTNSFVHQYFGSWTQTDHWPTFNVADIAICIGVGLMAVDMFTHRPRAQAREGLKQDSSAGEPAETPAL